MTQHLGIQQPSDQIMSVPVQHYEPNLAQPPRIVAVTSYQVDKIKSEATEAGIKQIKQKPVSLQDVHVIMWEHFHELQSEDISELFKSKFK